MARQTVFTEKAPQPLGRYSHGVRIGDLLFTAGQIALDPTSGKLVDGAIEAQTLQCLNNLQEICLSAGAELSSAVKVTVYLADLADAEGFNRAYDRFFSEALPARALVCVAALPLGAAVEVEAVVALTP